MNYVISKAASIDLENIWSYTLENWSIEQADRYLNLIIDEIEFICIQPHSGINYNNIRKNYFRTKVKSHFIFYKINKSKSEIEVIRILHEMMDIDSLISG